MTRHADPATSTEAQSQPDVVAEFTQRDLLTVIAVALAFALTPWMLGDCALARPHAPGTKKSTASARSQPVRLCGAISPAPAPLSRELPRRRCVL